MINAGKWQPSHYMYIIKNIRSGSRFITIEYHSSKQSILYLHKVPDYNLMACVVAS